MADRSRATVSAVEARRIRAVLAEFVSGTGRSSSIQFRNFPDVALEVKARAIPAAHEASAAARVAEVFRWPAWLKDPAVQAIGLGSKIKDGVDLGRPAFRVYVDEKRPLSDIANPVPRALPTSVAEVETDVLPVGAIRPQAFPDRLRPIRPGCSIGHVAVTGGTLGCIVRKRAGGRERYILSNAHVLAAWRNATVGDAIIQPAMGDGGLANGDRIASLSEFVEFDDSQEGFPNRVDAAIAAINLPDVAYQLAIWQADKAPKAVVKRLRAGMKVQKVGRSTGHSWGKIEDTACQVIVPYVDPRNGTEVRLMFRDQIMCTVFTDDGDSGALVLTSSGKVAGLHFAGTAMKSFFNPIRAVFDELDIELDT
ncbi:trypsin-like serine protease [Mesorhizobium sp. A623]